MEENKKSNKIYWKGLEELTNELEFVKNAQNEFPEQNQPAKSAEIPSDVTGSSRRDFLKMMGFSLTAVSLAACEQPVRHAIPYITKPEDIEPTISNYYASSYVDADGGYDSVLVETREGRPIKIEPNNLSSLTHRGTGVKTQASPLNLYDNTRLNGPRKGGKPADWKTIDSEISSQLGRVASGGGAIRLVTSTVISPTTKAAIRDFLAKYPGAQHVVYDAVSYAALLRVHNGVFPYFDFSKANVVVGIGADFLGTWPGNTTYSYQYAQLRQVSKNKKEMNRHYQFESTLTLTGSNSDHRTPIKPSQEGLLVAALYNRVAKLAGAAALNVPDFNATNLDKAARDLFAARGRSLVISGSQDVNVQAVVADLNRLLGAYGSTIDTVAHSTLKAGDDTAMAAFAQEVQQGRVGAVIFYNANPVYNYPAANFAANLQKVGLKISFADRLDETASLCDYVCPDHNYLESWGDAEPRRGYYSVVQPTINPIFQTRHAQESLLTWAGAPVTNYYAYLQNYWRTNLFPQAGASAGAFEAFWTRTLHDGIFEPKATATQQTPVQNPTASNNPRPLTVAPTGTAGSAGGGTAPSVNLAAAATAIGQTYKANNNATELCLYEKIGMGSGDHANNPYLQEFPDPISRACWDNYLTIPRKMAVQMELVQGDVVQVAVNGKPPVAVPVLIQPGQAEGTVGLALGYGRTKAGKAANNVGKNAFPLANFVNGTMQYVVPAVNITKTEGHREIAQVQTHHTIMARPIVQEASLSEYVQNPAAGRHEPKIATPEGPKSPTEITLWKGHQYLNHSWGMVIDLNSCTGCGACVVACNVENNIPVVGRQEVLNRREMHWLRIDRYYSSDADPTKQSISGYKDMEEPSANPEVIFQPMLCQQCQNAPCETVCPVIATAHSSEGVNMMVYNRCIGTRYCANNCPYKVRRFNWFKYHNNEKFDYHTNNDLGKMVLNPDVTVRSRGVMEKCNFCMQRIQEGKLNAKKERRRPRDGEIVTACAQACATGAITFGDLNDTESRVAQIWHEEETNRGFRVLEEINTRPQITYLTKIRNKA